MKFYVHRPEVHYSTLEVEANSKEQAVGLAKKYSSWTSFDTDEQVEETDFFEFHHIDYDGDWQVSKVGG